MSKITALAVLSGVAAAALLSSTGTANAEDAPRNGNSAPHSTAPVVSLINGDVSVLNNLTAPFQVAVPILGSKVGAYQGGNENAAPQADGDLLPINDCGGHSPAVRPLTLRARQIGINPLAVQFTVDNDGQGDVEIATGDAEEPELIAPGDGYPVQFVYSAGGTYEVTATDTDDPARTDHLSFQVPSN